MFLLSDLLITLKPLRMCRRLCPTANTALRRKDSQFIFAKEIIKTDEPNRLANFGMMTREQTT